MDKLTALRIVLFLTFEDPQSRFVLVHPHITGTFLFPFH